MSQTEREPVASERLAGQLAHVIIDKYLNPVGYRITLLPGSDGKKGGVYISELGEAASPDPVISDVTESIQIAGASLDYQPLNTAHTEIMDQVKFICEGNDHRYVIRQLQRLSESMKPTKPLRK